MIIYHCCVQKTASQWFRKIFNDNRIVSLGFVPYDFYRDLEKNDPRLSSSHVFTDPFPLNSIVTPLYICHQSFNTIPKNDDYRAFFVSRDPRDLVVSWYFSTKNTHPNLGKIQENREKLKQLPLKEGLCLSIDILNARGYFDALSSWIDAPRTNDKVKLVKYEDITSVNNFDAVGELFHHCEINLAPDVLHELLVEVSFEKLASRKQGVEDQHSHYRKGIEGDWINYFDDDVESKFYDVTKDLTTKLGYFENKAELLRTNCNDINDQSINKLQQLHRPQNQSNYCNEELVNNKILFKIKSLISKLKR